MRRCQNAHMAPLACVYALGGVHHLIETIQRAFDMGVELARLDCRDEASALPAKERKPDILLQRGQKAADLRLRPMEERDLDAVVTACRDAATQRWTTLPASYRRGDAEGFLRHCRTSWADGSAACFVIADADDAYAGTIYLRLSATDPLAADVGFMTAPHARGRGYQPAALVALSAWGFTSLGLGRVEWAANVGNTASRRVAEKAGFVFEGTRRAALTHRGERVDVWVAALTATDLT